MGRLMWIALVTGGLSAAGCGASHTEQFESLIAASDPGDAGMTRVPSEPAEVSPINVPPAMAPPAMPSRVSPPPPVPPTVGPVPPAMTIPAPSPVDFHGDPDSPLLSIGDSWMPPIHEHLEALTGRRYLDYSIPGDVVTRSPGIPGQFDDALRTASGVRTVVMTGGGNDTAGCLPDCEPVLLHVVDALAELYADMDARGVRDLITIKYSKDAGLPEVHAMTAQVGVEQMLVDACDQLSMRCHSLNTDDLVAGDLPDGIHPSDAASERVAQGVIDLMVAEGIEH